MKSEEYRRIRYYAAKAYNSVKEDNLSDAFVYLWMLNYYLGILDRDLEFGN